MASINLTINNKAYTVDVDPQMPLLWVIRDIVGLKGTKFGCGMSLCGACTIHFDGVAVRSCTMPVSAAKGKKITTIEGISEKIDHPVQKAWINIRFHNVDIVNRDKLCLPLLCSSAVQNQLMNKLTQRCKAIFAAAALINEFALLFIALLNS